MEIGLGNMTLSKFSTIILQITILDIDDCDRMKATIQKKVPLLNRIHLYIIKHMHNMINQKYLKKERDKNFKFLQQ